MRTPSSFRRTTIRSARPRRISRSPIESRLELVACRRGAGRGCASRRRPRRRSARRRERRERRAPRPPRVASAMPSSVSWSVSAIAARPTRFASRTTSAGGREPSDAVECDVQVDERGRRRRRARCGDVTPSSRLPATCRSAASTRRAREIGVGHLDERPFARARADRRVARDAHLAAAAASR